MNSYVKPLLEILEVNTNDVLLASGIVTKDSVLGFNDAADERL